MVKDMKKRIPLLLLAAVMLLSVLSGCGAPPDTLPTLPTIDITIPTTGSSPFGLTPKEFEALNKENNVELVIIVGKHDNTSFPTAEYLNDNVADLISRSYEYDYDEFDETYKIRVNTHVIVADGNPIVTPLQTADSNELDLKAEAYNSNTVIANAKDLNIQVIDSICSDSLKADDPEVDLVKALFQAYSILSGPKCADKEKHILIIDSGICTAGNLDMNLIDIQEGTVDNVLKGISTGAYVDLSGINVTFLNLGNFADDQMLMTDDADFRNRFESFWEAYLATLCHATVEEIHFATATDNALTQQDGYHKVTAVPFRRSAASMNIRPADATFDPVKDSNLVYNEDTVGFEKNKATFKYENKAEIVAQNIKNYYDILIRDYPDVKLYVVGSISVWGAGKSADTSDVSSDRADAVIDKLVAAGIPRSALVPIDAGTTVLPWRNAVEFPNGQVTADSEANQEKNRVVAVIPSYRTTLVQILKDELGSRFIE